MGNRCSDLRTTIEVGVIIIVAITIGTLAVVGAVDLIHAIWGICHAH